MIDFEIPGAPHGKQRPRKGRGQHFYTPKETVNAEALVKMSASEAIGDGSPMEGPVSVTVVSYLPIPASWSRKRKELAMDGVVLPDRRPDLDNLIKTILDGSNGVAFLDDKQVCALHGIKVYDRRPRTEVRVRLMDGSQDFEFAGEG